MQPCAPEPQLFDFDPGDVGEVTVLCIELTGTLAEHASVRIKPVGPQGEGMPVLCMDLHNVGPSGRRVHATRVFPPTERADAEALASQLRKGMRVTVACPLTDMRLSLPNVQRIDFHPVTH